MIVIFDKCVILDSLMDRKPFSDDSNELFKMMAQTAESIKADYIITRNIKDFKYSNIKAINPANFLSIISK